MDRTVLVRALARVIQCLFLGKTYTLLSQCLSPPRSINGYRRQKCWEVTCDVLASHPGGYCIVVLLGSSNTPSWFHSKETGIVGQRFGPSAALPISKISKMLQLFVFPIDFRNVSTSLSIRLFGGRDSGRTSSPPLLYSPPSPKEGLILRLCFHKKHSHYNKKYEENDSVGQKLYLCVDVEMWQIVFGQDNLLVWIDPFRFAFLK